MNDPTPAVFVQDLLPLLRAWVPDGQAKSGIALGGSYAKGIGDDQSDVDLYLFAEKVLPGAQRSQMIVEHLGPQAEVVSWGQDEPFEQGGTDFWHHGRKVEVWLRNSSRVEVTIAACCRGEIRRDWVRWTVQGFFNYVVLSDVHVMQVVDDPQGLLAGWKAAIASYPAPLREAILARFLPEAHFWPQNFHYRTAIARADVIYTTGIVQQTIQALIQVLFALNRVYFPGEKKLAQTLDHLPLKPPALVQRVQALLYPGRPVSVGDLEAQRLELVALLDEIEQLAKKNP